MGKNSRFIPLLGLIVSYALLRIATFLPAYFGLVMVGMREDSPGTGAAYLEVSMYGP